MPAPTKQPFAMHRGLAKIGGGGRRSSITELPRAPTDCKDGTVVIASREPASYFDLQWFPSLLDEEHLSEADDFAAGVALGPEVRLENPWDPRILSRARRRWAALRATFRAGRPASPAWAPPTSPSSVIETAT